MKRKEGLGKRLRRALEIDEMVGERDVLQLYGINDLTVRECGRILHYSECEIVLSLREYILKIGGEGLYCTSYFGGTVRVDGVIKSLCFDRRERKK